MTRSLVLVVDDDEIIRGALAAELRANELDVIVAIDGRAGATAAHEMHPDVVLTDIAMPHADGFSLIRTIRERSSVPILVLSVRGAEQDKVRALDLGADDYVTKPFSAAELLARVRAQLRRTRATAMTRLAFPDLVIDLERRHVVQGGREIRLTPTELELLELFARNAGRPLTFAQIISRVWGGGAETTADTVRVHVGSLRRKIEPDPSEPRYLVTEPWIGFRFIAEPL